MTFAVGDRIRPKVDKVGEKGNLWEMELYALGYNGLSPASKDGIITKYDYDHDMIDSVYWEGLDFKMTTVIFTDEVYLIEQREARPRDLVEPTKGKTFGELRIWKQWVDKVDFYSELVKNGMTGKGAWDLATNKYGHPLFENDERYTKPEGI